MSKKGLNIYKRKDGRWEARYIKSRNSYGKPIYGYLYAVSYREAKVRLQQVINAPMNIERSNKFLSDSSFKALARNWLENSSINFKESTYIRYRNLIENYLIPEFQNHQITDITHQEVEAFCCILEKHGKQNRKGLSRKTISDILSVLRRILHYTQSLGIPIDTAIFEISLKQESRNLEVLSLSEQRVLQQYLLNHPDPINLGILLCLFTGIRIGELCALSWENISLFEGSIHICQTMQRIQQKNQTQTKTHIIITPPKSNASNRIIPLPTALVGYLEHYPLKHEGYFLSGSFSKVIEPRAVQYRFHRILEECRINKKNFHILRHTFATRCIEANIEIKTLSEILGHSSVNITMNRYVHPSLELKRESMDKLVNFITVK